MFSEEENISDNNDRLKKM